MSFPNQQKSWPVPLMFPLNSFHISLMQPDDFADIGQESESSSESEDEDEDEEGEDEDLLPIEKAAKKLAKKKQKEK